MLTVLARLLGTGLVFAVNVAQAQAGSLDTTFGRGGMVTAESGISASALTAIEQSNGDIAVVTARNKSGFPNLEVLGRPRRLAQRRSQPADGAYNARSDSRILKVFFSGACLRGQCHRRIPPCSLPTYRSL